MTYDARQIANWFIRRAESDGRRLTIMSVLKLTYIAHGWHLEMNDKPLFKNRIEAWQYGPVIPDVYQAFRDQGIRPTKLLKDYPAEFDDKTEDFLEQVYSIYGSTSPFRLSELTHIPDGPWQIAVKMGGTYTRIPDDLIKLHYISKRQKAEQAG